MKHSIRTLFTLVLAVTVLIPATLFLTGCSNGDDYLYDEEQSTFIEVSAEMAYSFDSSSTRMKSDTLTPTDTLIFIANILPSKSIKIKRYLWTMDGEPLSYDFSFRKNIDTPGLHKVAFFLETYLGDTLSDTLTLQVSNLPVLDVNKFIPAPRSQGIATSGGISFAWQAYDPDSIAALHYRFAIEGIVDTIISEPAYTYWGSLPPLEHLHWSVRAVNEFGFASRATIHGDFFTQGGVGESGITGAITAGTEANGAEKIDFSINVTLLDSLGNTVFTKDMASSSLDIKALAISPLSAGKYKIAINVPEYPDYKHDTLNVLLRANEVLDIDTLTLHDNTPPRIAAIAAGRTFEDIDTLEYSDTLRFIIRDSGSQTSQITILALMESTLLTESTISGDTFTVVIPATGRTWNKRLLDIIATDASKNQTIRNYVIEGGDSWFKTNPNPTVVTSDSVRLYIIDNNHYGFTPDTFYFYTGKSSIAKYADNLSLYTQTFSKFDFDEGDTEILSGIRYTNGITQWKRWTLTRKDSTGGTP